MKATNKGFALLELLMATALAGLVVSAAMEAYKQVLGVEQRVSRKNLLEQNLHRVKERLAIDFNSVFIPRVESKSKKKKQKAEPEKVNEPEAEEESGFFNVINDGSHKSSLFGYKLARTTKVSFCATSPIVFGHESPSRAVRVTYLIEESKAKNSQGEELFDLYRVETENLEKTPDKKAIEKVYKMLLIKGLEDFSVQCVPGNNQKEKQDQDVELLAKWGKPEQAKHGLPEKIVISGAIEVNGKSRPFEVWAGVDAFGSHSAAESDKDAGKPDKENDDKESDKKDESKPKDKKESKDVKAEAEKQESSGGKKSSGQGGGNEAKSS